MAIIRKTFKILLAASLITLPVNAAPTKIDTDYFSGKVGIGILDPVKSLHVKSNANGNGNALIEGSVTSTGSTGFFGVGTNLTSLTASNLTVGTFNLTQLNNIFPPNGIDGSKLAANIPLSSITGYATLLVDETSGINNLKDARVIGNSVFLGNASGTASAGSENLGVGDSALNMIGSAGTKNIALGYKSLGNNIQGNANTAMGYMSGTAITGSGNIVIGNGANLAAGDSERLNIGNAIYGNIAGGAVAIGIGKNNPTTALDVVGTITASVGFAGSGAGLTGLSPANLTGTGILPVAALPASVLRDEVATIDDLLDARATSRNLFLGAGSGANVSGVENVGIGYDTFASPTNSTGTRNLAIGNYAMNENQAGKYNIAIGDSVLNANTGGDYNTSVGFISMYYNSTGHHNSSLGSESLFSNTTGYYNTAIGNLALYSNTTGSNNTSGGYNALAQNTTGIENTAFGSGALNNNTLGSSNVAVGFATMLSNNTGINNTAIGYQSLLTNTTGYSNTAVGFESQMSNTLGYQQTSYGYSSLRSNTTGIINTAIGGTSLYSNTTGSYNTALGNAALYANTTAHRNVAVGESALRYTVSGFDNTAVGSDSLKGSAVTVPTGFSNVGLGTMSMYSYTSANKNVAVGQKALYALTTGSFNTAVGAESLSANTTGADNVAIGNLAGQQVTTGGNNTLLGTNAGSSIKTGVNNIMIGSGTDVSAENAQGEINIGNTIFGNMGTGRVGVGKSNPTTALDVVGTITASVGFAGSGAGLTGLSPANLTGTGTLPTAALPAAIPLTNIQGALNTASVDVLSDAATGVESVFVGQDSGLRQNAGTIQNTGLGFSTLIMSTGATADRNTAVGYFSLRYPSTGSTNTAVGDRSLRDTTTGGGNTAVGSAALAWNIAGSNNSAFGVNALSQSAGSGNTAIGQFALGSNSTGSSNIALGAAAGATTTTGTNNLLIGNFAVASAANASNEINIGNTIYGNMASQSVGLGTRTPLSKLHVYSGASGGSPYPSTSIGTFEHSDNAYISLLTPNNKESGILFGQPSSNVSGGLVYNSAATLLGLQFRTNNNQTRMVVDAAGQVGVGTLAPAGIFDARGPVNGTAMVVSDPKAALRFAFGDGTSYIQSAAGPSAANTRNDLVFSGMYGYNPWMTLKANTGNVGIGTTSPAAKLDVAGQAAFGGAKPSINNFMTLLVGGRPEGDGLSTIRLAPTFSSGGWSVDAGDNVSSGKFFQIFDANNSQTRLHISNSGNVGIGKIGATEKLEVTGNALATDFCTTAGKCLSTVAASVATMTPTTTVEATTGNWTVPAGVTSIKVKVWGPGGNGGLGTNYFVSGAAGAGAGGGGGGGAYAEKTITIPAGTTSYPVVIGTPGIASSFGGTLIVANSGNSGANASSATGGAGGTGGTASGSSGLDVNVTGLVGDAGASGYYAWCPNGYSQAGNGGNGANGIKGIGLGAAGAGVGGVSAYCPNAAAVGTAGSSAGAGGGGASGYQTTGVAAGANGRVVIEYGGSSSSTGTAAILPGWPDAIRCGTTVHYLETFASTSGTSVTYRAFDNRITGFDKTTRAIGRNDDNRCPPLAVDLQEQYWYGGGTGTSGGTTGGGGTSVPAGVNTSGSILANKPDGFVCETATSKAVYYFQGINDVSFSPGRLIYSSDADSGGLHATFYFNLDGSPTSASNTAGISAAYEAATATCRNKPLSQLKGFSYGGTGGLSLDSDDSPLVTFSAAFTACQTAGKRLPTAEELINFAAAATASNKDADFLWTTTPDDARGGFTVVQLQGSQGTSDYTNVIAPTNTSKYRCVSGGGGGSSGTGASIYNTAGAQLIASANLATPTKELILSLPLEGAGAPASSAYDYVVVMSKNSNLAFSDTLTTIVDGVQQAFVYSNYSYQYMQFNIPNIESDVIIKAQPNPSANPVALRSGWLYRYPAGQTPPRFPSVPSAAIQNF